MKNDLAYFFHIRENISDILKFTDGDFNNLYNNTLVKKAVERSFQIIGDAAGRISDDVKIKNPHLEWRKIKDFRNKIVHDYFDIDYETVWQIIENDLPKLQTEIENIIKKLES